MKPFAIMLASAAAVVPALVNPAQAACCNYGCCDCSCVAFRAEEQAVQIEREIEHSLISKSGPIRLQSFTIEASDEPLGPSAPFSCAPTQKGAICTRER